MNEDRIDIWREQDVNLRDALRMEEEALPQMPADLNAKTLSRPLPVREESSHSTIRRLWPWVAAACVAGVMMILLLPQKGTTEQKVAAQVEQVKKAEKPKKEEATQPKAPQKVEPKKEQSVPTKRKVKLRQPSINERHLVAQQAAPVEEVVGEMAAKPKAELAQAAMPSAKSETLTDRDIPITRPENYKYTPEEIALLKKQANEAYLKWVELELEIAKYNQEQTAQK
jgi:hypothetical protein